jgi:endonuclease YncB( thermonuclease family)
MSKVKQQRGEAASAFTKNAIATAAAQGGKFQATLYGWDKFGGRVLGDILVNGQSLRAALIANGFAREYYGEAKQSWCQ